VCLWLLIATSNSRHAPYREGKTDTYMYIRDLRPITLVLLKETSTGSRYRRMQTHLIALAQIELHQWMLDLLAARLRSSINVIVVCFTVYR